jgi:hypothetical protein
MTRFADNALGSLLRRIAPGPVPAGYDRTPDGRDDAAAAEVPIAWGVATADWDSGSPNEISLHPCDDAGGNVDTGTTITCYLLTPTGEAPAFCAVAEDDVVAYVPFGAAKGIAVNAPLWPFDVDWPLRIQSDGTITFDAETDGVGVLAPCFEVVEIGGIHKLCLADIGATGTFQDANAGDWWDVDKYGRVKPD